MCLAADQRKWISELTCARGTRADHTPMISRVRSWCGTRLPVEARPQLEQVAPDQVRMSGISGSARTPTLKVSLGCTEGFIGEDMFFYAGPGCLEKARLAKTILAHRFQLAGLDAQALRIGPPVPATLEITAVPLASTSAIGKARFHGSGTSL